MFLYCGINAANVSQATKSESKSRVCCIGGYISFFFASSPCQAVPSAGATITLQKMEIGNPKLAE